MSTELAPIIAGFDSFALIREKDDFSLWRARLIENGISVEIILAREGASKSIIDRLFAVYSHIKAMAHPNVIRVFELHPESPTPYIVTEHCLGRSLYSTVKDHGPFDSVKVLRFARQIGLALDQLNSIKHFVVRNLKPDNIRIDEAGNIKLCDFTLAIIPNEVGNGVDAEDEGNVVGTPQYISPEQAAASPDIDFKADLYSLGAVLYYLSSGVIPFDMPDVLKILDLQASGALPDPRTSNPDILEDLVAFISYLMIKNPNHRYKSWTDAVRDIKNIEAGRGLDFEPPIGAVSTIHKVASTAQGVKPVKSNGSSKSKRSFLAAITPPFCLRVPLWIFLFAWFVWLADARLGSPMNLPGSRAIAAFIDRTLQDYNEDVSSEAEQNVAEPEIIPLAEVPQQPISKQEPEKLEPQEKVVEEEPIKEDKVQLLEEVSKEQPKEPEIPFWGGQVMEQLRKGNFKEALRIAETSQSSLGMEVAQVLSKMPDLDEAVAAQVILQKGKETKIVFMGRTRILVPLNRMSNTVISTSFNGRIVRVDVAQFSPEEKLRWLRDASDEGTNARALALALQLVDDAAIKHHASRVGALSKLFSK